VNLKEQGRLLRQNEFLVWEGRSGKKSLRQVFLFEELILFSKARRFPDRKVFLMRFPPRTTWSKIIIVAESWPLHLQKQYQNDRHRSNSSNRGESHQIWNLVQETKTQRHFHSPVHVWRGEKSMDWGTVSIALETSYKK